MERTGHGTWDKEGVGSRGREEEEMVWENVLLMCRERWNGVYFNEYSRSAGGLQKIKATFRKCKGGGGTKLYFVSVGEGIRQVCPAKGQQGQRQMPMCITSWTYRYQLNGNSHCTQKILHQREERQFLVGFKASTCEPQSLSSPQILSHWKSCPAHV